MYGGPMTIADQFASLAQKGEKALVLFVTAGDPALDQLGPIIDALHEGGADIVELGIPFSDPIADGHTIQASSQRALDRGVTPSAVLDALGAVRLQVPVVAMGYYNPILRVGISASALAMSKAGLSGTIISDLTPEESAEWIAASAANGLNNIFLVAPTSTDQRIEAATSRSSGFVYAVSRTGVTGAGQAAPVEVQDLLRRTKAHTKLPVCAGFGVSTPDHVRMVCEVADGAVIGSFLVDLLNREWNNGAGKQKIVDQVAAWKAATRV